MSLTNTSKCTGLGFKSICSGIILIGLKLNTNGMKKIVILFFALLLAAGCSNTQRTEEQAQDKLSVPEANIQTQSGTINVLEELNKNLSEEEMVYAESDSDLLRSDTEIINNYGEAYNAN
jgi:hypothetical protein